MIQLKPRLLTQVAQGHPRFPDQQPGSTNKAQDAGHADAKNYYQNQMSKWAIFIYGEDHSEKREEANSGE
jgi:hypothetical protein